MDRSTYFVASADQLPLRDFAERVFRAMEVQKWSERFSSNYPPDEHYFAGDSDKGHVRVSDSDDDRMVNWPACVSIDAAESDTQTIVKQLTANGLRVFVPKGKWWLLEWDGEGDVFEAS